VKYALTVSVMMLCRVASAQYHVDEIPYTMGTIRGDILTHVPGSSHNIYGPCTVSTEVEPVQPSIIYPVRVIVNPTNNVRKRQVKAPRTTLGSSQIH